MNKRSASPPDKKHRLDYEAENPQSRKVGIVCHSTVEDDDDVLAGDYEIKIYIVDVDRESFEACGVVEKYTPVDPAVRFTFPGARLVTHAVCVLKSTVYLFWGYNPYPINPPDTRENHAAKFVLSEEILAKGDYRVKGEELTEIPRMHHAKAIPRAIPTPDGKKIIVFGMYIALKEFSRAFELYDPEKSEWDVLPDIPWICDRHFVEWQGECLCYREVTSYSFIDDSHFFLETTLGSFSLDLEKKEWTCLGTDVFPPAVGYFVTAGKGQCAATSGAAFTLGKYGFENPDLGCGPPLAESTFAAPNTPDWEPDWEPEFLAPSIVPLHPTITQAEDGGGDVCNTCVLRVEKDPPNQNENGARILMDLCHTGVTTLMSTVSKCVSLRIDFLTCLLGLDLISL